MTDIAIIALVVVALVLAVLRIWEQSRLKKATGRLLRSHSEFDRVLDRVSEYVGMNDEEQSVSAPTSHGFWYRPEVGGIPSYFICRVHGMPWPSVDTERLEAIDDVWLRERFDEIEAEAGQYGIKVISMDPWMLQDKPEYEPAHR